MINLIHTDRFFYKVEGHEHIRVMGSKLSRYWAAFDISKGLEKIVHENTKEELLEHLAHRLK